MSKTLAPQVHATLAAIKDSASGTPLTETAPVQGVSIQDGRVRVALAGTQDQAAALTPLCRAAEQALMALPGISAATVVLTGERPAPPSMPQQRPAPKPPIELPHVRSMVAIASGKGGVGKSTTAANLAMALRDQGLRVGLFDADVYGPSVPLLMGLAGQKPSLGPDKRIIPLRAHGLDVMSIGFMIDADSPLVWRGPMVMGALEQLLRDVAWGSPEAPLDVILVDMPPGTGDTQITMAQKAPLTGAVIVSTPQDLALLDARKGLAMFRKVNLPVLGMIENMSTHICPSCGYESHLFGHGGVAHAAEALAAPFLGALPLDLSIRLHADAGTPLVAAEPDSPQAQAYRAVAAALWAQVTPLIR